MNLTFEKNNKKINFIMFGSHKKIVKIIQYKNLRLYS